MRITKQEKDTFVAVFDGFLKGARAELYLFGSRAKDHLRGGDIDLLLATNPEPLKTLEDNRPKILGQLYKKLGERRIDLTMASFDKLQEDPFLRTILPDAVLLHSWA